MGIFCYPFTQSNHATESKPAHWCQWSSNSLYLHRWTGKRFCCWTTTFELSLLIWMCTVLPCKLPKKGSTVCYNLYSKSLSYIATHHTPLENWSQRFSSADKRDGLLKTFGPNWLGTFLDVTATNKCLVHFCPLLWKCWRTP